MSILSHLNNSFLIFDGGMGTELQKKGILPGECPELWNKSHPNAITEIHRQYFLAGANVATANTFGANSLKIENVDEIVTLAIGNAKKAVTKENQYVALDIGPTGRLLKPLGDLDFEDAISVFSKTIIAGTRAGADLILIETMSDPYETKAAVIAAKENSDLPVFVTFVLDSKGKTVTGASIASMIALLEALGVDAIGLNCSLGADQLLNFVPQLTELSSLPIIVNPNAGMPVVVDGKTIYKQSPEEFGLSMRKIAQAGARGLGGCCGTTPEHIECLAKSIGDLSPLPIDDKNLTVVSSYFNACFFDKRAVLIGERINPTGKPKLKEALRSKDMSYLINEAVGQEEKGAEILDVNVGLPDVDEKELLVASVKEIQSVTSLPLQLDSADPIALEKALRIYNGKALINSVNGKTECMNSIFPLVKKYGGVVIGLTLDENGIPSTSEERYLIAKKIVDGASSYGINKKDIIIDPLCLTVSSDSQAPRVTLEAIELIKSRLGVKTSLGISNVSFGLPQREIVNSVFFSHALQKGLDAVIMNPYSELMMKTYYAHNALMCLDENCQDYIMFASNSIAPIESKEHDLITLDRAIVKGLKKEAQETARELLQTKNPLEIVNEFIIPALNEVGDKYEHGRVFLPQLLMSADTATLAFNVIKEKMTDEKTTQSGEIAIATVKGDVHDIGKNIVKVILENYGFVVHDLGKDVAPEVILDFVKKHKIKLVGLSALMTTTVPAMEKTIALLNEHCPDTRIMVGGAVLTDEYAKTINADKYAKDAMESVRYAQEILK